MSTITKEWLQQEIADMEEHSDLFPGDLDDNHGSVLAALRIALASLEAEVVYQFIYNNPYEEGYTEWLDCNEEYFNGVPEDCRRILYTAPPAPVSVPDEVNVLLNHLEDVLPDDAFNLIDVKTWNNVSMLSRPDVFRAAMLQGADGNSPDGWVACIERMPGEVLAALQNVARLRRNLNDFCGEKSVIAKCLIEAEEALLNAVNRHSTMLAEPLKEAKNV